MSEDEREPEVQEDTRPRRSFSQLSSYTQCSEQFRLERIVRPRVVQRPALWNTLGTGIHYAFEMWINSGRTSDMHADFEIGYEEEFAKQVEVQPDLSLWNNPYRGTVLEAKETVRAKGHEQVDAFFEWLEDPEHELMPMIDEEGDEPEAWTEVQFELDLDGIRVVGFIDLVEEGGLPIDFKGLALDTPLATPSGWTTMAEVQVGDQVYGSDGQPCSVTHKSVIKNKNCYRVHFSDATSIVCDDEHLWWVEELKDGGKSLEKVLPIEKIKDTLHRKSGKARYRVPISSPLELSDKDLPIHPYLLGLWLGDGRKRGMEITNADQEVWENIQALGYELGPDISGRENGLAEARTVYGQRKALHSLGVVNDKHIPDIYLRSSFAQRVALLQGLMDSDGTWNKIRNQAVFTNTNERLSDNVYELISSLGQRPAKHSYIASGFGKTVNSFFVSFTPLDNLQPFGISRKANQVKWGSPSALSRWRHIEKVEEIESVPTQCIGVNSFNNTYLAGKQMVPTHNSGKKDNSKVLQLGIYKVALEKLFGYEVGSGQFFYTRVDGRSKFGRSEQYDLTRYTEEYVTDLFRAMENGIANNVFIPNPGTNCGICSVKEFCRSEGWRAIPLDWESIPEDEVWWT